ncbi:hypothetical protein GGS23DRAFT_250103 [Durotheca rogersii]|uniref:uncharacterized protein n=1 Tax=Durotheca rogersii TaxID=419775 RepID=UPI00222055D7|nr:uncharacterized protein GGS23DRAFT_250103 [Durotheca rogersii]KAI5860123.1 hypothetical protein GGS23DRAFT_250103 [Durotheca rogersii]
MKYGEHFEAESVPGWSLHNIDYNSLKYQIKAHTSKDQATAIAIPGQQDYALKRFEDAFYHELCDQHSRVGLFVSSKADEISRRLHHLSSLAHRLLLRCNQVGEVSAKRQRRLVKYALQIEECDEDVKALSRFVGAQVTAFHKILKKYRKWTGSTTLSSRFKENVLSSPKSFTKRDFAPLRLQYRDLLATLEAASPELATLLLSSSECQKAKSRLTSRSTSRRSSQTQPPDPPPIPAAGSSSATYWNEYEHGSEAGDNDDGTYAIYIDPDASVTIPGFVYIKSVFTVPIDMARHWLKERRQSPPAETRSLLHDRDEFADYSSTRRHSATATVTDNEGTEDEYASSLNSSVGRRKQTPYSALPPTEEGQEYQLARYRDMMMGRAAVLAFLTSFILLIISGVLIATGRHKMRLEVDAGVAVGSVTSLFCACMGLGVTIYRQFPVGCMYTITVWVAFTTACVLNGMLLVLVVGSNDL